MQFKSTRALVWGILVTLCGINYFHMLSMGVIKEALMLEFALSESGFVAVANMTSLFYIIMQLPTGLLVDTWGARNTAATGCLFGAIGLLVFCMAQDVWMLYVGRSLVGIGASVGYVSIMKIQANWYESEKFGTMTGMTGLIGGIVGAFSQAPLAYMSDIFGWRNASLIICAISLLVSILIFAFVRNTPAERGFTFVSDMPVGGSAPSGKELWRAVSTIAKNRASWPPFFIYAAFYGSFAIIVGFYGVGFMKSTFGLDDVAAATFTTIAMLGSCAGSIVIGKLSDRYRTRKKPALYAGIAYAISWIILIYGAKYLPLGAVLVLMCAIGFLSYGYVVSWPVIKEVNDLRYVGITSAIINIGGFAGSTILPYILGFIFDGHDSLNLPYTFGFTIVLGAVILGIIAAACIRETHCKDCEV